MDGSRERPSAIPRLSRLPVARAASSIPKPASVLAAPSTVRRAPSDERLGRADGGRQPPKLRHDSSRTQLRAIANPPSTAPLPPKPRALPQARQLVNAAPRRASSCVAAQLDAPLRDSRELADSDTLPDTPSAHATPVKAQMSLAERTVGTLAQIPSSPAMTKRPSSFFEQARSASRADSGNSRPSSSYNSDGSATSSPGHEHRPGSSADSDHAAASMRRTPSAYFRPSFSAMNRSPSKPSDVAMTKAPQLCASSRRASMAPSSKLCGPSLPGRRDVNSHTAGSKSRERSPVKPAPVKSGAKTLADTSIVPRAPVKGLFRKPSMPVVGASANKLSSLAGPPGGDRPSAVSRDGVIAPLLPTGAGPGEPARTLSSQKSSSALRQQIARAKAAKRAVAQPAKNGDVARPVSAGNGFDFDTEIEDPFNLRRDETAGARVLKQRIATARTSGKLNIAALGLKEIPTEVMKMYDLESIGTHDGSWAESVDLTRLMAADNELASLGDAIFPDVSPDSLDEDEDGQGHIFYGLETLDLHGNVLADVPLGFRCLAHLTSLNLSSNRLGNECLDIISHMVAVRDLKLSKNRLSGPLSTALSDMASLEALDVHGNSITALPKSVENLSRLRILNLSENKLDALPFDSLSKLPLVELSLRKSGLSGTLIREPIHSLPFLQTLDASSNQLTRLAPPEAIISLPAAHSVSLSMNRLQELPDMTTWTSLVTLAVDENNISTIPQSFLRLEKLRHADFSSNDIKTIPNEIARMTTLTMLRLAGNPLRDRKFATASIDEVKETLAGRLEPPPPYQEPGDVRTVSDLVESMVGVGSKVKRGNGAAFGAGAVDGDSRSEADDDFATPPTSAPHSPARSPFLPAGNAQSRVDTPTQMWPVKPGGLLDRSKTASSALCEAMCSEVAACYQVRQVQLHHNLFTCMPNSLGVFASLASLSLSHNQLAGDCYLTEKMTLPALREINMASNLMTSLEPLMRLLEAPLLDKVDVSMNRIRSIPHGLRQAFPQLTVLLASNNQLTELEPESIRGLKTVDASSNEIAQLNPRIGLLGGQGGLQRLEVSGNRFKVPKWQILERGTEATLRWLRGRVPAEEMAAWREGNDEESGDEAE